MIITHHHPHTIIIITPNHLHTLSPHAHPPHPMPPPPNPRTSTLKLFTPETPNPKQQGEGGIPRRHSTLNPSSSPRALNPTPYSRGAGFRDKHVPLETRKPEPEARVAPTPEPHTLQQGEGDMLVAKMAAEEGANGYTRNPQNSTLNPKT